MSPMQKIIFGVNIFQSQVIHTKTTQALFSGIVQQLVFLGSSGTNDGSHLH